MAEGLVQLGPVEPVSGLRRGMRSEAERFHLWVIASPSLDYGALRKQLGSENVALRLHFVEYASQAMAWLSGINCAPVHAFALNGQLTDIATKSLVASIRARRELRRIPLFVCDKSYEAQRSRELYAAGANGYLCGQAATRQLGAAILRSQHRVAPAQAHQA